MTGYLRSLAAAAAVASIASGAAHAQDWPSQPITLLVPWAAGGGTDPVARLLAEGLSERLGQPVLVDFHPGAAGSIGTNLFLDQEPDGYTLMITSQAPLVHAMFITPDLPYDSTRAVPIAWITNSPTVIAAHVDVPADDLGELIAYARENPGEVNAAISGIGSVTHLAMSLIEHEAEVEFNIVPYSGAGAQLTDLMSGVVDIGAGFPAAFLPGVDSGQLKILGTLGDERLDLAPDAPTSSEIGYPNIRVGGWFMLFGIEGTPEDIINRVNEATNDFLQTDLARERLEDLGYQVISDSTPESTAAQVALDRQIFGEVFEAGAMNMDLE